MKNIVRGYKVTDKNMQCRGYQFELNKKHIQPGEPVLCKNGFHFCEKLRDCFNYYEFNPENRVFEIIAENVTNYGEDKSVCSEIVFEKELSWVEVLTLINTGENNTGIGNSGNCNSGYRNSGNYNSGYRNSGDYNSGNHNNGHFNTITPDTILVFNKPASREEYENYNKPNFLFFF